MAALNTLPKIAIVAASAPPYGAGGVASAHYNLWRALVTRGYPAQLFTFFDNGVKSQSERGIVRSGVAPQWAKRLFVLLNLPWRLLQPKKLAYHAAEILRNAPGALRMSRAIEAFAPDVVLLSDHGAPGLWLRKRAGQRFVLVSHHNPARIAQESGLGDFSQADVRTAIWLENQILQKIDHVICPSHYMLGWFKKTYRYSGPVSVAPNMIDLSTVDAIALAPLHKRLQFPAGAKFVYLPSAGSRIKGADYLIAVINKLLSLVKDAVGFYIPGDVEPEIAHALQTHPAAASIFLPGQINYPQHVGIVKSCDIAISPALMENFSMAILEAAYLGLPVVAFQRGGNADIIADGENGYLIAGLDADAMAVQAADLLNSPQLSSLKRSAEAYTRQKFSADNVLDAYLAALAPEASPHA